LGSKRTPARLLYLKRRRENGPDPRHGQRAPLGEGVVVEVEDAELRVVLQGCSQRRHTCVGDAVLGHVDFFQAAHQLTWGNTKGEESTIVNTQ